MCVCACVRVHVHVCACACASVCVYMCGRMHLFAGMCLCKRITTTYTLKECKYIKITDLCVLRWVVGRGSGVRKRGLGGRALKRHHNGTLGKQRLRTYMRTVMSNLINVINPAWKDNKKISTSYHHSPFSVSDCPPPIGYLRNTDWRGCVGVWVRAHVYVFILPGQKRPCARASNQHIASRGLGEWAPRNIHHLERACACARVRVCCIRYHIAPFI